jgi:hypothetical protein
MDGRQIRRKASTQQCPGVLQEGRSEETVLKPVNGAGLQPLSFLLLHSRGSAPGWYEAAPSALKRMRSHTFESAKGASHISLGQRPRKESQQEIKG